MLNSPRPRLQLLSRLITDFLRLGFGPGVRIGAYHFRLAERGHSTRIERPGWLSSLLLLRFLFLQLCLLRFILLLLLFRKFR